MNTPLPIAGMIMHAPSAVQILGEPISQPLVASIPTRIGSPGTLAECCTTTVLADERPDGCLTLQHISSSLQRSTLQGFRFTCSPMRSHPTMRSCSTMRSYFTRNQPQCLQQV